MTFKWRKSKRSDKKSLTPVKGRKRYVEAFIGACVFFSVGYFLFWCFDPANFPILSVKFVGERKFIAEQDLRKMVRQEINEGFFRLKVSNLRAQLLSLPWVKEVDIRKVWPDQLVVHFAEHTPAALWDKAGLLSSKGTLFEPEFLAKKFSYLPLLTGPEGRHSQVWDQFSEMSEILAPLKLKITQMELAPRGAWQLRLSNGITVVLGTDDILQRLRRFVQVYQKQLSQRAREMAYVDLRYTSGMAIGWKTS
ncbi:MAG: cell division protein FtsQ/DivIB [Candidatus Berkiellales bacterium]